MFVSSSPRRSIPMSVAIIYVLSCVCGDVVGAFTGGPWIGRSNVLSPSSALFAMGRRGRPQGPLRTIEVKPPMNQEITFDTMRVVTQNPKGKDEPLGVMSKSEALAKASELGGLDLIVINAQGDPPVCKIVDYSKYRYMKEKKAKEVKKNSKASEVKEVKMSYKIDVHDYNVRKKNASKFLKQGNRVKLTVFFKGREVQHEKIGVDLLMKLADEMSDLCQMENKPRREGRFLSCFVGPRAEVMKALNDKKRKKERDQRRKREASKKVMDQKEEAARAEIQEKENVDKAVADKLRKGDGGEDSSLDELLGGDDLMDDLFG